MKPHRIIITRGRLYTNGCRIWREDAVLTLSRSGEWHSSNADSRRSIWLDRHQFLRCFGPLPRKCSKAEYVLIETREWNMLNDTIREARRLIGFMTNKMIAKAARLLDGLLRPVGKAVKGAARP